MGTEGSAVLEPLWRELAPLDRAAASGSATCALPPRYEAVKSARDFTRETLERWRLDPEFDTVALVVSELVTNALRHGLTSSGLLPEVGSPVRLDLMRWAARLVCAVRDPSAAPPESASGCDEPGGLGAFGDFAAESGRGLCLVESFSDSWGWHPLTGTQRGKVVWAVFRLVAP
jgi:anti-sigma regulatory factor (Ser/Thr protein kinase)